MQQVNLPEAKPTVLMPVNVPEVLRILIIKKHITMRMYVKKMCSLELKISTC